MSEPQTGDLAAAVRELASVGLKLRDISARLGLPPGAVLRLMQPQPSPKRSRDVVSLVPAPLKRAAAAGRRRDVAWIDERGG